MYENEIDRLRQLLSVASVHECVALDTAIALMREAPRLYAAQAKLDALEAHGVDNWVGYDDAMADLEDE